MEFVEIFKNIKLSLLIHTTKNIFSVQKPHKIKVFYSTVTDFARFLGWSTSVPLKQAT